MKGCVVESVKKCLAGSHWRKQGSLSVPVCVVVSSDFLVPLMFFNLLANFNQNLAEGKDHLNFQEIRQQRKEKVKQELEPREELECECSLRQPRVHMGKSYNKHLKQGKAFPQPCKPLQDMRLQESRCHLI